MNKHLIFTFTFILTSLLCIGQGKRIKFKDEYKHSATNTIFPKTLFDYKLKEVNSFDKKKENVCVEYKSQDLEENTKISIYLYPAFSGVEGRLRDEYLNSITAINYYSKNKKEFKFSHSKIEDENFIVNGLKTSFIDDENNNSELSIYECGTWFFKIRITSKNLDLNQIENLEKEIVKQYKPTDFTKLKPLNLKGNVSFSNPAFRDSLFLVSTMSSSFKKFEWAIKNVSEKEKKSGFPDLYLNMHIESIKKFTEFGDIGKNKKMERTEFTGKYINGLKALINSGFLEEYIMENFNKIMIVPVDIIIDYEGFNKWRETNSIPEFLFPQLYRDSYEDN